MPPSHPPLFKGAATALITPLKNGKIDFRSMEMLIDRQLKNGISALVICGTTGEASTLTPKEQRKCIDFAVKCVKNKIPIIAGSGSNCTSKAIELSLSAEGVGADALLIVTPYYNKATPEGLIRHYSSIADAVSIPIILYNVPSRTGVNIPLEVYQKLSWHENIIAVKEASGDIDRAKQIVEQCGNFLYIYSGNDENTYDLLKIGASGVISASSNVIPEEISNICRYFFEKDYAKALDLQKAVMPLLNALFCEVNPIPIKFALSMMRLCENEIRLPLCEPSVESKKLITDTLLKFCLA